MKINYHKGFTLVELLVVILIIGVLAAIALPHYKIVVYKARYIEIKEAVNKITKEFDMYYLVHGEYPPYGWDNFKDGFSVDYNCRTSGDYLYCQNFTVDIYSHGKNLIVGFYGRHYGYGRYLTYSNKPSQEECLANKDDVISNNMCKSLGGEFVGTLNYAWNPLNEYKI